MAQVSQSPERRDIHDSGYKGIGREDARCNVLDQMKDEKAVTNKWNLQYDESEDNLPAWDKSVGAPADDYSDTED